MCKRTVAGIGVTLAAAVALLPSAALGQGATAPVDWPTFGGSVARTFYNGAETAITAVNVTQLVPEWHVPTIEPVTASPAVATVSLGGTATVVVYDADFAGNLYAVRADSGLPVWTDCLVPGQPPSPVCAVSYPTNPGAQVDYGVAVDSPAVGQVTTPTGIQTRVFEGADALMWAVDASTGATDWSFNAAGDSGVNNYEIEASPLLVTNPSTAEQMVVFSIDCNGYCDKPGGVYAVDAVDGHLVWFFDDVSGSSYRPTTPTNSFAPTDVGPTTAGAGACGGIWTSQAADLSLNPPLLFTSSADCPQDPLASSYYEAAFALNLETGAAVWSYQPRQLDQADLDYGATPNVFSINGTDVVGFGSKDGSYTAIDATPVAGCTPNPSPTPGVATQCATVQWKTKLTVGGNFGGFYNGTTDGQSIYLTSALGTASATAFTAVDDASKGRVFAVNASNGALEWDQPLGAPTLGQNSAIPGVYFDSGLDHLIHAYSTASGQLLAVLPTGGANSSTPVVAGGKLFVGAGTGSTYRAAVGTCLDPTGLTCANLPPAPTPIPIYQYAQGMWAFCLATDPACVTDRVATGPLAAPAG